MSPGRAHRATIRWIGAGLALTSGVVHLALAGVSGPPVRSRPFVVHYTAGAIFGARYLVLLAGLTLVLSARPLSHGKRTGWWLALAAALVSIPSHHVKLDDAIGGAVALLLAIVLLATRRSFRVRSDPQRARQGWQLLGAGLLTMFVYGVVGISVLDGEFAQHPTVGEAVTEALRLLVLLPTSAVEPATRHGAWFVDSVRVGTLAVVLTAVVRLVATTVLRRGHSRTDEARVRELLDAYATTGLARFHLLDDKLWFFGSDGQAFIGYKLVGRCAVALGEPVGAAGSVERVTGEFLELCESNGWVPAFHQVTEAGCRVLATAGLSELKIGEEAIVPVQDWSLDDKRYKSLRSALRRVERAGYHLEELVQPIDETTMAELRAVSDAWLASGDHRERTFTLGRFDPAYLRDTTVLVARHTDGHIGAFANVLPTYRAADGNFDLMRRHPGAPNGVMEFLFVGLIERFRAEGRAGMTLGLAPLSGVGGDTLPERALALLYERGNRAFNFEGLRAFKDKWQPRWEPRFICYRRATELPLVATAVTRAGELPDERSLPVRVGAIARQFPFSVGLTGILLWFMVVTESDRRAHATLVRHLGLAWFDLVHLQLWRLGTSQLVQSKPGLAWSILAMLPVLPIAERRLGSRRAIAVFALADWCSTVPILLGGRIAAALGSASAAKAIAERDTGTSSGAWALAVAVVLGFPKGRWRTAALTVIIGFQAGALAVNHKLFDLQHLAAIAVAVGLVRWFGRSSTTADSGRRGSSESGSTPEPGAPPTGAAAAAAPAGGVPEPVA